MEEETIIEGYISSLAFGGEGILKHQGLVLFVPFTLPGEKVRVSIEKRYKHYARAKLLKILEKSPDRKKPLCPHYGKCGGCQLQHLSYEKQGKQKALFIQDSLERLSPYKTPEVSFQLSESSYEYRRHITLKLIPKKKSYLVGYTSKEHTLLSPELCPIFSLEKKLLPEVYELIEKFQAPDLKTASLKLTKVQDGFLAYFSFKASLPKGSKKLCEDSLKSSSLLKGFILSSKTTLWEIGETSFYSSVGRETFLQSPLCFSQNHPELSSKLYQNLQEQIKLSKTKKILDLYCGTGITSILFAMLGISVTAIEVNKDALKLAKKNAEKILPLKKRPLFLEGDVDKHLALIEKEEFKTVFVNPPREGLSKDLRSTLEKLDLEKLFYISCNPTTLARDLAAFPPSKYKISFLKGFDLFPQTSHLETLLCLERKA